MRRRPSSLPALCINRTCVRRLRHLGGGGTPYGQPQSHRALSTYCTPVPAGSLNHDEQMSFDWFKEMTTKKFAGLFKSDFWETLVFQASAQEPAVRHAVVALSAAHRFDPNYEPWTIPTTYPFDAEQFTLQQYNKAIQHLKLRMGRNEKNDVRVALITCMIFVTLEYLRGLYKRGSAHLRHGIALLSNIPEKKSPMTPNVFDAAEDFAHNALIDSYARLSIQSAMFGHVPASMCAVIRNPKTNALPYNFPSASEARQTLDDLLNRIHCLKRHSYASRENESKDDMREMVETQEVIMGDLALWRKAFDNSIPRFMTGKDGRRDQFGHLLLVVYYEMAMIKGSTCLSDDEMIFDQYTHRFLIILTAFLDMWKFFASLDFRIRDMRKIMDEPSDKCAGNGFTVESGFIPPIYYTTLKCRDPGIRRQAIAILRSVPHREGVWNGPLLADIAEQLMKMEEAGVYDNDPTVNDRIAFQDPPAKDLPPPKVKKEMRVSDVSVILPDRVDGDTFMRYSKREGGKWQHFSRVVQPGWLSKLSPSTKYSSLGLASPPDHWMLDKGSISGT
ncbi:hypothetical protein N7468_006427 [Penicillium chermesinum]|uniref:C6 zinc finger domain protein n=1 Tax=Penicillium chermesinum TaxID=63820 RepID=A0A9W9NS84_9EURO|nr:uncharacterized protein N7468_006427 [Penicillium chermesinum]KAJ5225202.1 hypothetical protein N7468_006427 [Penicillium chermesinum]